MLFFPPITDANVGPHEAIYSRLDAEDAAESELPEKISGATSDVVMISIAWVEASASGSDANAARQQRPPSDDEVLAMSDDDFFAAVDRGFERLRRNPAAWKEYQDLAAAFAHKSLVSRG